MSDNSGDAVKSNQEETAASRDNKGDAKQRLMELLQGCGTEEESQESAIESDDHNGEHNSDNRSKNFGYDGNSDEEVQALQAFDGANAFPLLVAAGGATTQGMATTPSPVAATAAQKGIPLSVSINNVARSNPKRAARKDIPSSVPGGDNDNDDDYVPCNTENTLKRKTAPKDTSSKKRSMTEPPSTLSHIKDNTSLRVFDVCARITKSLQLWTTWPLQCDWLEKPASVHFMGS